MKRLVIDIGHGGKDSGAVANGLKEKDHNLLIGLGVRDYLQKNYNGISILLTRETDKDLSPDNRVKIVTDFNPHLCVSVHHNSFNSIARGAEVIHANYDLYDDALALAILAKLAIAGMPTRRAFTKLNEQKRDWYYMIRRIWDSDTQAIICEGGFVDNKEDSELLKSTKYIKAEIEAIALSIAEYLKLTPALITEEQRLYEALAKLQNVGIIDTPLYWIENAKDGKMVKGVYARSLAIRMGEYLNRG